jgi:hypothetical protein
MAKDFLSATGKKLNKDDEVVIAPEVSRPGDRGVVWIVESFGTTNVTVLPKAGGRGLRTRPEYFIHADEAPESQGGTVELVPLIEYLRNGTVVRPNERLARRMNISTETLLCVSGPNRAGTGYRVEFLGGDDRGRYFTNVSPRDLTVIPLDRITVQ